VVGPVRAGSPCLERSSWHDVMHLIT